MSWLDLQLMFKQYSVNTPELSQWLDTVAKAAIDVFQLNATSSKSPRQEDSKKSEHKSKTSSIWLVAPLIAKLSSAIQGRVLKVTIFCFTYRRVETNFLFVLIGCRTGAGERRMALQRPKTVS